jgi:hypothetical protein
LCRSLILILQTRASRGTLLSLTSTTLSWLRHPNANYEIELHYFYRPVSLTAGADSGTTWLSINAELTLLYGALVEAYIYMKGEPDLMALYNQRFQESLVALKMFGEAKEVTQDYRVGQIIRGKQ